MTKGARLVRRVGETPEQFRRRCIREVARLDPRRDVSGMVAKAIDSDTGKVTIIWPDAGDADDRDSDQPSVH